MRTVGWLTLPTFGADDSQVWAEAVASKARAKRAEGLLGRLLAVPPPDDQDHEPEEDNE